MARVYNFPTGRRRATVPTTPVNLRRFLRHVPMAPDTDYAIVLLRDRDFGVKLVLYDDGSASRAEARNTARAMLARATHNLEHIEDNS